MTRSEIDDLIPPDRGPEVLGYALVALAVAIGAALIAAVRWL